MSMTANPPIDENHAVPPNALTRLAEFALAHRRAVAIFWVVLFVAGAAGAGQVSKRLSFDFSLPGQPGYETAKKIDHIYGNGGQTPPTVAVVNLPAGTTIKQDAPALANAFQRVRAAEHRVRVVDYTSTGDSQFVTRDGRSTYAFFFGPLSKSFGAPKETAHSAYVLRASLPPGYSVQTTGLSELSSSGDNKGPGVFVETLFGGLGALAVLAFVFASLLALVPLMIAAVSILTTLLVILGLSYVADVSLIVQFLVSLVGLGVAIDYSLLLVTRWREERARGLDNHDAVVAAMGTAGRAVLLSGLTVAIGLVSLVVLPVPGLRSVGYGGMLIPLVSTAVALTLLPAMLGSIGPRVDWPRVRDESHVSHAWSAWARGVVKRKWLAAGVAVALLGVLIVPVFGLTTGQTSASALAKTGSAHDAYQRLRAGGVPSGVLTPVEVLAKRGAAPAVRSQLAGVAGMASASVSTAPDSNRAGTTVVVGVPKTETVNNSTLAAVRNTRTALDHAPGVIGIAGDGAIELDYQHAVFGSFPLMFAVIALLTFVLLARAFRSVVLAAKALLLNLISLGATFGVLTWFWQQGHGSDAIFGIPATGAIAFWLPLMVFAFLFGLSMDYEVFILARMREEYDRTGSTDQAVVRGLGRTGRLVTSAALILFLAFASLASAPDTDVKVLATGLGIGILLDATIVRALLLPALVALLGRWNWWMPEPVARLLRVSSSVPRKPEPVAA